MTKSLDELYPPEYHHRHLHEALWQWAATCCVAQGDVTEQRAAIEETRSRFGKRGGELWNRALIFQDPGKREWLDAELWHAIHDMAAARVPVRLESLLATLKERQLAQRLENEDVAERIVIELDRRTHRAIGVEEIRLATDQLMRIDVDFLMRATVEQVGAVRDPAALAVRLEELSAQIPQEIDRKASRRAAIAKAADADAVPRIAVSTGNGQLDAYLRGGFGVGEFTVIALSTNEGKSTISCNLARNVLYPNAPRRGPTGLRMITPANPDTYVLLVSLEDPLDLIYHRLWMDMIDLPTETLDNAELRKAAFVDRAERVEQLRDDLLGDVLDAVDSEGVGSHKLADVLRTARAWLRDVEARNPDAKKLLLIDHIQCLVLGTREAEKLNRERELALISESLTSFARKRKVALVCTAMLNGRAGADAHEVEIRESAAIEQAAHVSIKAHSCQSFRTKLEAVVKDKLAESDADKSAVLEARLALALNCHTLRINKSRTTGGRGGYITWHTRWDRARISTLSIDEAKLVEDLNCDLVGWARELVFNTKDESTNARPWKRSSGRGNASAPNTSERFDVSS